MIDYQARREYMNGQMLEYIRDKDLDMLSSTMSTNSEGNAFPPVKIGPMGKGDFDRWAKGRGYDQISDSNDQCDMTYVRLIYEPGTYQQAMSKTLKVGGLFVCRLTRAGLDTEEWTLQEHSFAINGEILRSQGYFYDTVQNRICETFLDLNVRAAR